jgi:hypothetical protein
VFDYLAFYPQELASVLLASNAIVRELGVDYLPFYPRELGVLIASILLLES